MVYVCETNPWGIDGAEDFLSQEMINHSMIRKGKRCRCWLGSSVPLEYKVLVGRMRYSEGKKAFQEAKNALLT